MAKHIPNTCGEEAGAITGQSPPRNTPARATDPWLICARERCLKKKQKKNQPRDVTSTMQTTMTITPVVRKFSSNRLFNASKQPCGQKRRWSGATEKEPTFATAFYLFERAANVAWLRTAGRWNAVAPVCMVIYPTALELKPRGHSGDAGLLFLQRKSLGLTLVWIRSHSFIAFVEFPDFPFASSRPRIRSAFTKLPIWWGVTVMNTGRPNWRTVGVVDVTHLLLVHQQDTGRSQLQEHQDQHEQEKLPQITSTIQPSVSNSRLMTGFFQHARHQAYLLTSVCNNSILMFCNSLKGTCRDLIVRDDVLHLLHR